MPGVLSTLLGFTGEPLLVQYLVIAGGGGGGSSGTNYCGGGGAGGYRSSVLGEVTGGGGSPEQRFRAVLGTQYSVSVGAGGGGGSNGVDSSIFGITSTGGGAGRGSAYGAQGFTGGSGGGGTYVNGLGGLRTTTPIQGNVGGVGSSAGSPVPQSNAGSGGGGGAGGPGFDLQVPGYNRNSEGAGGQGLQSSITGIPTFYAAGGVGSSYYSGSRTNNIGGGSNPGVSGSPVSNVGTINTGSGGGGGVNGAGGPGGSGIIILRYPVSYTVTIGAGLSGTTAIVGTDRVTRITSGTGNISFAYAAGLQSFVAEYLVVAGGGAGGTRHGGGGGGGGVVTGSTTLFTDSYSVTVGAGGSGRVHSNGGLPGQDSSAFGKSALGGGGGHGFPGPNPSGGSGGGAADSGGGAGSSSIPGTGLQPASASGGFGNNGGLGQSNPWYGGGGGGAGAVGGNVQTSVRAGSGGIGYPSSITGTSIRYAGGGGGASWQGNPSNLSGFGGEGGGANGATNNATPAGATANTGGGGGAHGGESTGFGGNGGSGVIIVRYPSTFAATFGPGVTGSNTIVGSDAITTITAGTGNVTWGIRLPVEYLVVAGGGSGGSGNDTGQSEGAGGGGAGGMRTGTADSILNTSYLVTVGAGGPSTTGLLQFGNQGQNSVFSTITSTGGGAGGRGTNGAGGNGGSGGGGGSGTSPGTGGTGIAGQGRNGANGAINAAPGGGGGAGAVGISGVSGVGGNGGAGLSSSITGTPTFYAGGGAGGGYFVVTNSGGVGGGGAGGNPGNGFPGTANTGGGGGGAGRNTGPTSGAGGSGVVILKYPDIYTLINSSGLVATTTSPSSGFKVTTITSGTGYVRWLSTAASAEAIAALDLEARIPPITTNLLAVYDGDSWTGSSWQDIYGTNHATTIRGTITASTQTPSNGASKTFTAISGNTSAGLRFPAGILPATYTLFHVTRTTGGTRARIFSGFSNNWLSGHWSNGSGIAYHEGWLTDQANRHGNNWFYSTDQNSLYRSNGVTRGTGGGASTSLSINHAGSEYSDWSVALTLVYSGTMSAADYQTVEAWIANRFGI